MYRWRIYLWNVSYALSKTAHLKHIKQRISVSTHSLSVRASDGASASRFKLKLESIGYRLLYLTSFLKTLDIKLVTCLEQIVLSTFSETVQSPAWYFFQMCSFQTTVNRYKWYCLVPYHYKKIDRYIVQTRYTAQPYDDTLKGYCLKLCPEDKQSFLRVWNDMGVSDSW